MGFEFNRGSFQSRLALADRSVGDLVKDTVQPAPEKTLPWYLSRAKRGNFFLSLRVSESNNLVKQWLSNPQIVRRIKWIHQEDPSKNYEKVNIKSRYDGIVFIENTTSVRPTPNALEAASKREKF
jgi:erythromycin esterase-like protein